MNEMTDSIWVAFALLLIFEGVGPLLFPNRWQRLMQKLSQSPVGELRQTGALLVIAGLATLFFLLG